MPTFTYPNTSGIIDLAPSSLSGLGITLAAGDTLNIPAGSFSAMKATGLNGATGNPITINFLGGSSISTSSYVFDNEIIDCSFLLFIGINSTLNTDSTFAKLHGATHDIEYRNCGFAGFTAHNAFEVGVNYNPKVFAGTKASSYYNLKWKNCVFDGMVEAAFIVINNGISLDCELDGCTFKNVNQPSNTIVPIPVNLVGFGWKIHHCQFLNIGGPIPGGHNGCIYLYGYADIYNNLFTNQWANDVRCFPMKLNFTGYTAGQNRYWNNISHNKLKYSMFEFNTNNTVGYREDASGYYLNNTDNFVYFNTMYRSKADTFQANLVDLFGAEATVKGNLIIVPEFDKTFNGGRNYAVTVTNQVLPAAATEQYNITRGTLNLADFDPDTFTPVAAGTLLDNMAEDIGYITTDYYGNPRKVGTASDAGAVEYQAGGAPGNLAPVANAGSNATVTLPSNTHQLDGSASSDSDGTIASYAWTKLSGPSFTISNAAIVNPMLSNLVLGTYVFQLTVTDNDGATNTDTVTITVNAAPANNVIGGQPNGVIARQTISFVDAGLTTGNTAIIFLIGNPLKSYRPGRAINGITGFETGKSYYWVALADLEVVDIVAPPL